MYAFGPTFRESESSCVPGAFLNDTLFPDDYNYMDPTTLVTVNDRTDATSQRFHVGD